MKFTTGLSIGVGFSVMISSLPNITGNSSRSCVFRDRTYLDAPSGKKKYSGKGMAQR
jgi:hypothetical protein